MKLHLYTPCYPPDHAAYVHLIENLAEDLVAADHEVTVITSTVYSKPGCLGRNLWQVQRRNGVRVIRINTFPAKRKGLIHKAFGFTYYTLATLVTGCLIGQPDLVFAASTPPTMGLVGGLLGKIWRVPFVYNVQDIFPDVAIKLGLLRSRLVIQLALGLEQTSYRLSTRVVVIGDGFADVLYGKGVPEEQVAVIPNWVDTDAVNPPPRQHNSFVEEHRLQEKFVVLYAGNFGLSQGLELLVDAAKELQVLANVQFLMVGDGERRREIEAYVSNTGVQNVKLLPFQPSERLRDVFGSAHLGIVPLKRGLSSDSIPSKTWTMMAAHLPIVVSIDTDAPLAEFIREHGVGVVVQPESSRELAAQIRRLYHAPEEVQQMGNKARAYVAEHLCRKMLTARYRQLFEILALRSSRRTKHVR